MVVLLTKVAGGPRHLLHPVKRIRLQTAGRDVGTPRTRDCLPPPTAAKAKPEQQAAVKRVCRASSCTSAAPVLTLAKMWKFAMPLFMGRAPHGWHEGCPEFRVEMFRVSMRKPIDQ